MRPDRAAPPAGADADAGDEDPEEGEPAGLGDVLQDTLTALAACQTALGAIDVKDEAAGVKSAAKALHATLLEAAEETQDLIDKWGAAHENDEDEEPELVGDDKKPTKKAPPKKGPPGASDKKKTGDEEPAEDDE